jgi:hypothetical protein
LVWGDIVVEVKKVTNTSSNYIVLESTSPSAFVHAVECPGR